MGCYFGLVGSEDDWRAGGWFDGDQMLTILGYLDAELEDFQAITKYEAKKARKALKEALEGGQIVSNISNTDSMWRKHIAPLHIVCLTGTVGVGKDKPLSDNEKDWVESFIDFLETAK